MRSPDWESATGEQRTQVGFETQVKRPTKDGASMQHPAATRIQLLLSPELSDQLRELSQQRGVSLFVTLLSGWAVLLGRWGGQEEVIVEIRIISHQLTEIEQPICAIENAVRLRIGLRDNPTVGQLLNQTGATTAEACTQQHAPAAIKVSTVPPLHGSTRNEGYFDSPNGSLDLSLMLCEAEGKVAVALECTRALFERNMMEQMASCWQVLLERMVKNIEKPISELPILKSAQRQQVLYGFNDTAVAYPKDFLIHQLFENQVQRAPNAIALVCEKQSLTYAELNSRANQLAHYLQVKGIGPERLVGIYADRSSEMVVGLLGVLKSGAAYVPLDPSYPPERLAYMLRDAMPCALLTQNRLRSALPPTAADVIALDGDWVDIARCDGKNLDPYSLKLTPRHLAYVIYTSGTTGAPKGVAAEHRGMVNRIAAQATIGAFSDDDVCCQKTSIGFVDAIFEILGPLAYGRKLIVAPPVATRDVQQLVSLIDSERISRLVTVPSLAQALLQSCRSAESLKSIRSWTLSGEELRCELLQRLQKQLPECVITNLYGSSEVAADATFYVATKAAHLTVPIGQPIENTQIYIVDTYLQPVPIGVAGEIYIGGVAVARGYLKRPGLTAERFIADPFSTDPAARMYKTGDLGLWRENGVIEYLGRIDHQVKIRGYRIELGEIEAQLKRHAQIREAVVVANESTRGETRLVAYVTQRDDSRPSVEALRAHLKAILPEYMVPSAFVLMDRLPFTPSGKLDRRALTAPEFGSRMGRQYESPQGHMEQIVAGIWQELLQVERVGRRDNFFELGGHSLLIVQLMDRLRQIGLWIRVNRVFESTTLAELACALTSEADVESNVPPNLIPAGCPAITPEMVPLVELEPEHIERIVRSVPGGAANIQDIYPLAPLQEGLLFHHLLEKQGGNTYVLPTVLSVSSRERMNELVAALQSVIDRHDILRTAVLWEQLPHPLQVVYRHVTLRMEEIAMNLDRDLMEQIMEWLEPARQQMDLRRAPLVRIQVAPDAHCGRWYALLQLHHLIDDDVSLKVFISEVLAHLAGRGHELPQPVPYREHVAHALTRARTHDAEKFFREKLSEVDEPTAPYGLLNVHGDGSRISEAREEIEPELSHRIRLQARHRAVSPATLFHAGWALVVGHTSGRDDVVFGSVLLGRLQGSVGAKQIVGMFINTLPLRLRIAELTAGQLVDQTKRELVELLNYEQASLALAQSCSGIAGSAPLFSTVLNYRHGSVDPKAQWASASGIRVVKDQYRTNYPITLSIDDLREGFVLTAQTDRPVDPHRIAGYMHTVMRSLVEALENASDTPALALSIVPKNEQDEVIRLFNATQAGFPQGKLIHELIEEQVQRTPDALAVVHKGQSLTYAQMNDRANQLARHLISRGIGPDRIVGICLDRSLEMVVGLVGALKAGGAYVPLDPTYPPERLSYMLEDAAPTVLLTQERLRGRIPETKAEVISFGNDWKEISRRPLGNVDSRSVGVRSDHLAYVIYTSGSTGQPKGVAIEHRNTVNLICWAKAAMPPEVFSQTLHSTSLNFDLSIYECFVPLTTGGSVHVVDNALVLVNEPAEVTLMNTVPSAIRGILDSGSIPEATRVVNLAGEVLKQELVDRIFARSAVQRVCNLYGPSETTTYSTWVSMMRDDGFIASIGQPIANTRVYILDQWCQIVPIGVVGEIYIGGAGVARGYLNRPELTAERFVADSFSTDSHARMYKTGDLGRWRADGTIEYLGRNDHQVKIRGHRIEVEEIETQLSKHNQVKEAIVVAREDVPGEKRLVAYVVGDRNAAPEPALDGVPEELRSEVVSEWETLWKETYGTNSTAGPSFVGWKSSYTGEPIPEAQMQEWLACTVARVQALQPKKLLEVGCGVGLLLQHLAAQCEVYVGTDFSAVAIEQLRKWVMGREDLKHVELLHRSATELHNLQSGTFDTVLLNSVVQYFPDVDYLLSVLQEAVRLLTPGGKIFIGDVRHLGLLPMFHSAVQLSKATATVSVGQLKRRIARAVAQEKELVIDPQFFHVLPGRMPGISAVEVQLKRGQASNELTRYRYDVVLHTGEQVSARPVCERLKWQVTVGSAALFGAALQERRWRGVLLHSIPNIRLAREVAAQGLISRSDERIEAGALRRQVSELRFDGVDPDQFWDLGQAHGYDVIVSPGEPGYFEVQLLDRARADQVPLAVLLPQDGAKAWSTFANDPLENGFRQQLIPQLREYLKGRLPEYMIPSGWMALKELPLTPNGKVDRRALPAPQRRSEELGEYIPPSTELERMLADIWAQVLRVDQVGMLDNFFDLGGHSLLAMQISARIGSSLSIEIPMRVLFEFPTVKALSVQVNDLRQSRLLNEIASGGESVKELLGRVASMSESKAQELIEQLRTRVRP